MAEAVKNHGYYVVTYVARKGEGPGVEPEVMARGKLLKAAEPKKGVDGDNTRAVLSQVENHQCNGEASCEGCKKLHAQAEERVISRLVDAGQGRVAVAWRKYHPLVARGEVLPGQPFEAENEALKVRVEALRLVDGAVEQAGTINAAGVRALEKQLAAQEARGKLRAQVREAMAAVTKERDQALQRLAGLEARLRPLVSHPAKLHKLFAEAREGLEASHEALQAELHPLLAEKELGAAELKRAARLAQGAPKTLAAPLATVLELEQALAEVEALKTAVDALAKEHGEREGWHQAAAAGIAELERRLADHPRPEAVKKALAAVKEGLAEAEQAYATGAAALLAEGKKLLAASVKAEHLVDGAGDFAKRAAAAARPRERALEAARTRLGKLEDQVDNGYCRGRVSIETVVAGGKLQGWDVRFENRGDVPWCGTIAFVQSNKNDGIGFEAMACPENGSQAVQRIRAGGDYGVQARAGARLRVAVRGYAHTEVPLPREGSVGMPLKRLEPMAREVEYLTRDYVTAKRKEKKVEHHADGEPKIRFFVRGREV